MTRRSCSDDLDPSSFRESRVMYEGQGLVRLNSLPPPSTDDPNLRHELQRQPSSGGVCLSHHRVACSVCSMPIDEPNVKWHLLFPVPLCRGCYEICRRWAFWKGAVAGTRGDVSSNEGTCQSVHRHVSLMCCWCWRPPDDDVSGVTEVLMCQAPQTARHPFCAGYTRAFCRGCIERHLGKDVCDQWLRHSSWRCLICDKTQVVSLCFEKGWGLPRYVDDYGMTAEIHDALTVLFKKNSDRRAPTTALGGSALRRASSTSSAGHVQQSSMSIGARPVSGLKRPRPVSAIADDAERQGGPQMPQPRSHAAAPPSSSSSSSASSTVSSQQQHCCGSKDGLHDEEGAVLEKRLSVEALADASSVMTPAETTITRVDSRGSDTSASPAAMPTSPSSPPPPAAPARQEVKLTELLHMTQTCLQLLQGLWHEASAHVRAQEDLLERAANMRQEHVLQQSLGAVSTESVLRMPGHLRPLLSLTGFAQDGSNTQEPAGSVLTSLSKLKGLLARLQRLDYSRQAVAGASSSTADASSVSSSRDAKDVGIEARGSEEDGMAAGGSRSERQHGSSTLPENTVIHEETERLTRLHSNLLASRGVLCNLHHQVDRALTRLKSTSNVDVEVEKHLEESAHTLKGLDKDLAGRIEDVHFAVEALCRMKSEDRGGSLGSAEAGGTQGQHQQQPDS